MTAYCYVDKREIPLPLRALKISIETALASYKERARACYRAFHFPLSAWPPEHKSPVITGLTMHFQQTSGFDVGEQYYYEYDQALGKKAIWLGFLGEKDDTSFHLQENGVFTIKSISQEGLDRIDQTTNDVVQFVRQSIREALERQAQDSNYTANQYDKAFAKRFLSQSPKQHI